MTGPVLGDQAARQRIATSLDANLCVEAAAGTGKTTVLVSRVVGLLASGTVNVDQLVVITFTEKAAAELAARVRDTLEARARAADGEERDRLLVGRATCIARTSRRSTASRPRCCASARSKPGSIRCSRCSRA